LQLIAGSCFTRQRYYRYTNLLFSFIIDLRSNVPFTFCVIVSYLIVRLGAPGSNLFFNSLFAQFKVLFGAIPNSYKIKGIEF